MSIEVVEQLLRCSAVEVHRKVRYVLAFLTGLRDGEIAGLKFQDVFGGETQVLSVNKQLRLEESGYREGPPKTDTSFRDVPLGALVLEAMQWWFDEGWAAYVGHKATLVDLVFPSPSGKPWRPRSSELLRADLYLAGLPTKFRGQIGFVFHRARGSFTSWLARRGTPFDLRRALLGHGAVGVTDGSYEEQSERLPQEIEKLVLAVTLDDLKRYESPGRKAITAARKTAKDTANHNVLGRRRIKAEAEKQKAKEDK